MKMRATPTKSVLRAALPLCGEHLTVREWTRQDLVALAAWPDYPFPYQGLEFSFRATNSSEKDEFFQARQVNQNVIVLVVDHAQEPALGYLALTRIDWTERIVGNLGLRIHPAWCDKGIGTRMLRMISQWSFKCGLDTIRFDVAASNTRAIRCYEKVGFFIAGEMWRDAPDLKGVDINSRRYDFLRSHVRLDDEIPRLRFLLMQIDLPTSLSSQ